MPPFLICIHDATPAYARETTLMLRELTPLVGRRLSCGVVPDWHGDWPLTAHRDYCALVRDSAEELLLHGCFHQRRRGCGPISLLTANSDELNGLSAAETRRTVERGQQIFTDAFGAGARGFLPPAWQRGRVELKTFGLDHVLSFFALESRDGRSLPVTTWSWDCGRWGWLGHVGHGIGRLRHTIGGGVPVLAIHPRDLDRGFWPAILRLTRELLDSGHEPATVAGLLATDAAAGVDHNRGRS